MSRDRDAFEKWCVEKKVDVSKLNGTDEYVWGNTCMRWAAWQAALAYRDAELQGLVDRLRCNTHENDSDFLRGYLSSGRDIADELIALLTKEKE